MRSRVLLALVFLAPLLVSTPAHAGDDQPPIVVGISHFPPSAIKAADGSWTGTCVDAWKRIAEEQSLRYVFRDVDPKDVMAKGLEALGIDVVGCVGVNPRTEKVMDVTHPFSISGLGIATRPESSSGVGRIFDKIASWRFARSFGVLLLIIIIAGVIVWRFERQTSPDDFGGPPLKGIGGGVFWTVEALFARPKPLSRRIRSRLIALFWVIASILLISGVTAKLSAEFTVNQLSGTVSGPKDLQHARIGASIASNGAKGSGARYLDAHGIPYKTFVETDVQGVKLALEALDRGELDAVVDSAIGMQYLIASHFPGRLLVLPDTIQPTLTAFGLRPGSPHRKQLNLTILRLAELGVFKHILAQYVGGVQD
jgi:ABC-type amino acid transport substrate-binding protein